MERPEWPTACEANEEEPLALVLPDGATRELPAGACDELAAVLGDLLKGVLLKARAEGLFAGLPKAPGCELGVEDHDGNYAWPAFAARGHDNLA